MANSLVGRSSKLPLHPMAIVYQPQLENDSPIQETGLISIPLLPSHYPNPAALSPLPFASTSLNQQGTTSNELSKGTAFRGDVGWRKNPYALIAGEWSRFFIIHNSQFIIFFHYRPIFRFIWSSSSSISQRLNFSSRGSTPLIKEL